MNRVLSVIVICLCLVVALGACQVSKKRTGSTQTYPDKRLVVLLDQGKVADAASLVVREEKFFASQYGDPKVRAILARFTQDIEKEYGPLVVSIKERAETLPWPTPKSQWVKTRKDLAKLQSDLKAFLEINPFQYTIYRPAAYEEAVAAVKAKERVIRSDASVQFVAYPLTSERSFFDIYPVLVDGGAVMRDTEPMWSGTLQGFSKQESDRFFSAYGTYMPKSAKTILGKKYFDSLCPNPKQADIKTILNAYDQVKAADMSLSKIPGLKVAFLQVTNPDLIRKKSIDFPLSIKVDVPFEARKASMIKMFNHEAVKEADILILVNVAIAKNRRVVESNAKIRSTFVKSYKQVENPEYAIVKTELESASEQYHEAKSASSLTWGASLIDRLIREDRKDEQVTDTKMRLDNIKEKFRETPKYASIPDYQPYSVTKAHMDIYKYATVNYYVIDKRNKRYFRDTFDYSEKSFFTVCYDIHQRDKNPELLLQTSVLEEDVVRHELEPVEVNLSDLLGQYVNTPSSWKKYASMASIHRAVIADSERAQALFNAEDFGYDKYYDQRFDSVVVVRNLGLGLGTGFYVTDDMVLTNYHVVEENEYVRLKLFNDRETMGRVIARDAHLDLALIQADVKGKPVCFYDKHEIPLGVPLEIIGHPDGLQFSITRGVLSTVRKYRPINYTQSKRENVLYIQTDAAANGGNSGGPMFYGDYVVGVVDWGKVRTSDGRVLHGLNFAIHYSEVFKFFDDHGIDVCKGSK